MEILETKEEASKKSLKQLKKSIDTISQNKYPELYEQLRDSLIQRFEFSFDAFWKYLKEYLKDNRKIELEYVSPNKTFKTSYQQKIITKEELENLIDSTTDRNLTSHTYNENLAEQISKRIPQYHKTMQSVINKIKL